MKKIILVAVLMILSISIINAQSGKKVEFQELGLSFQVPNGWTGGVRDEFYFLGHNSIPGLMILTENKSRNASELKNLAMQGMSTEGIQLSPKGAFKTQGNDQVEGFYEGIFQGSNVRVFAIGLINQLGSGMNIFVVTEKAKFSDRHIQEARKLARSVKFFKQRDSKETTFWKQRIGGKKLKYMKTRTSNNQYDGSFTGTSDSVSITLYNNGTFYFYSSSTAVHGGPSGTGGSGMFGGRTENSGDYKIYTIQNRTYLDLYFSNRTNTYELSRNSKNHTLLEGSRYSVLPIN